ncbi:MAG TPA: Hsp20/alpha crystallin family protein [Patescibacteria group bacterium]|nr:Hsp20/alpha crystallin family protein [Patescibacteria group bacterium]
MKLSWSKILGLKDDILSKETQEVEVVYEETKVAKSKSHNKGKVLQENKEDLVTASEVGQINIDLYEDPEKNNLVIKAKVPGAKSKDIDVVVEPELIIIRGERFDQDYQSHKHHYYYRECGWGEFLRRLVLPCRVKPEEVDASLKQGILKIVLPKVEESNSHVKVK